MGNEFFSPGEQRAIKVNELFARIAPRYDLINDLQSLGLHRRWKRRVVADAAPQPGERVLDVCCGTGDLAFALATGGAEVVGLDFNAPMLAVAARRLVGSGVSVPRFMQGDAMALPFPDAQFDIVTVGYGLRNLASWETGLNEMVRVAKPGARLLVLDFGKPDNAAVARGLLWLPALVRAVAGPARLPERQRLCLHSGVAPALPRAAGSGGPDAGSGIEPGAGGKFPRRRDEHQFRSQGEVNSRPAGEFALRSLISLPRRNRFGQNRAVNFRDKIVAWENLAAWRAALRASGKKLVVTNGCFDLLHPGHVTYLESARNQGDVLLLGLNGDDSVRQLKGEGRPVNSEADRAVVVAALQSVDGVCIFAEKTAHAFSRRAQPDIYVKGGDYTLETVNQDERRVVENAGGRVVILPFVPGKSTTAMLEKIARL